MDCVKVYKNIHKNLTLSVDSEQYAHYYSAPLKAPCLKEQIGNVSVKFPLSSAG